MTTVIAQNFRDNPVQTTCPHCQAQILTSTRYEVGGFAWLICAILCIVGCDLGCCFIPFCVPGCQDVIHSCPNCRQMISRWSRL
ncbi:hypothetical protein CAPTEDRAFT_140822 [Capitella teleta]|uniref:LITAF domain-containing protein n=1 Tax=Capitella teleta TaxID=283909 RepID=R7UGB7_CAPTE|nr:hypothetical protein CAPTEDRAFT_140822 [Capitella teleta]|eukprot:ELU05554.1 hypothetical protein CAPTEDRAFT_140822 [Capitella teleta]